VVEFLYAASPIDAAFPLSRIGFAKGEGNEIETLNWLEGVALRSTIIGIQRLP
jgi:hypothetical protein